MNRSSRFPFRRRAWSRPAPISKVLAAARSIAVPIGVLLAMAGVRADLALAASGAFDGEYRGRFVLGAVNGGSCEDSKLEQVMSISGERVYVERKSLHQISLLLSGTVSADGSVSASGVAPAQSAGGLGRTLFYTLSGKIQNGQFSGALSDRGCSWNVTLRK